MCSRMTRTNFDGRLLNSYCPHHHRFFFYPVCPTHHLYPR